MEFLGRNGVTAATAATAATTATAATPASLAQLMTLQVPLNHALLAFLALLPGAPPTLRSLWAALLHVRAQVYPK